MTMRSVFKKMFIGLFVPVLILLNSGTQALAEPTYDCGTYGSSGYNENCPEEASSSSSARSSSSSASTAATTEDEGPILLNDYPEYTEVSGKDLSLKVGRVINFNVIVNGVSEQHSLTIKEVGDTYVVVTFDATGIDVRIDIGETLKQDVTSTDDPEIEIKLNSITDGVANLTFRQYIATVTTPIPTKTAATVLLPDTSSSKPWLWIILVSIFVGLFVLWFLLKRRKKRTSAGPPTYQI